MPLILLVGAGLSVLSEIVVFRRFRNSNPATMMITSFALGFVIKYTLLMLYSSRPKSIDLWPSLSLPVEFLGRAYPASASRHDRHHLIVVLIALTVFLKRTRFGLEMRAAADNFTMARMLGVRANLVIMLAFALSGMLAAAIGLILATQTGTADIQMGASVMLVAFIATVIGGLGNLVGAVVAGFLIGGASVLMQVVLPLDARPFRDAFVYGAVIVTLLVEAERSFRVEVRQAEGVTMSARPSVLTRTISTPIILIGGLIAIAAATARLRAVRWRARSSRCLSG